MQAVQRHLGLGTTEVIDGRGGIAMPPWLKGLLLLILMLQCSQRDVLIIRPGCL